MMTHLSMICCQLMASTASSPSKLINTEPTFPSPTNEESSFGQKPLQLPAKSRPKAPPAPPSVDPISVARALQLALPLLPGTPTPWIWLRACFSPSKISGTSFNVAGFSVVTPTAKPSGWPHEEGGLVRKELREQVSPKLQGSFGKNVFFFVFVLSFIS